MAQKPRGTKRTILRVASFALFMLTFLLVALYLFATLGRPYFGGETTFHNSSEYRFSQNPVTRIVTIRKNGKVLHRLFFPPQVFAAWVDTTRPIVLLVTSDTGMIDGAHGLYLYRDGKMSKVYQSRRVAFADNETSPGRLYASYIIPQHTKEANDLEIAEKKELMNRVFTVSPDGRYLFGYESGYEGGSGLTIDLLSGKSVSTVVQASGGMVWNDEYSCAISPAYAYGDEQWVQLLYYEQNELQVRSFDRHFFASDVADILWGNGCSGVVTMETGEYDRYGMQTGRHKEYYVFSKEREQLTRVISYDRRAYHEGKPSPRVLENMFFTIKTPKTSK